MARALLIGAGFFRDNSGCRLEKDVHHPSVTVRAIRLCNLIVVAQ